MVKLIIAFCAFLLTACGSSTGTEGTPAEAVIQNAEAAKSVSQKEIVIAGAVVVPAGKKEELQESTKPAEAPVAFVSSESVSKAEEPAADVKPEVKAVLWANCSEEYFGFTISFSITDYEDDTRDVTAKYEYDRSNKITNSDFPKVFDLPDYVYKARVKKEKDANGNGLPTDITVKVNPAFIKAVFDSPYNSSYGFNPNYEYSAQYRIGYHPKFFPAGVEFNKLSNNGAFQPTFAHTRKCSYSVPK